MTKIYEQDKLLKSYTIETDNGPIEVEERDPNTTFAKKLDMFERSKASFIKSFFLDDEINYPSFPKGESHQWLYRKKGVMISLLEVEGLDWRYEIYPFDSRQVKLLNDPNDTGIERYNDLEEAKAAMLKLFEQVK